MIDTWLIGDTHFGHNNVIEYENRPFINTNKMDQTIIDNWNRVVKKHDKVYFLGDFSFCDKEKTKNIINQLNGYKIMIKGNHDKRSNDFWLESGFKEVSKYPVILINEKLILSHQPIQYDIGDFFNIHGHVHTKINDYELIYPNKYKCVSVELINYTPINIQEITG